MNTPSSSFQIARRNQRRLWFEVWIELFSAKLSQMVRIFRTVVLTHILAMLMLGQSSFDWLGSNVDMFIDIRNGLELEKGHTCEWK